MNELITNAVFINNGKVFASSEKVAEYFEKKHKNVLQTIQRLINQDDRCKLNFQPTSIKVRMPNGGIRKETVYNMTRDGFFFLTMGFTGKKAFDLKQDFIDAFNKMESVLLKQMQAGSFHISGQLSPGRSINKEIDALKAEKSSIEDAYSKLQEINWKIDKKKLEWSITVLNDHDASAVYEYARSKFPYCTYREPTPVVPELEDGGEA